VIWPLVSLAYVNQSEFKLGLIFFKVLDFLDGQTLNTLEKSYTLSFGDRRGQRAGIFFRKIIMTFYKNRVNFSENRRIYSKKRRNLPKFVGKINESVS
jgi:hypothetical protein